MGNIPKSWVVGAPGRQDKEAREAEVKAAVELANKEDAVSAYFSFFFISKVLKECGTGGCALPHTPPPPYFYERINVEL